MPSSVWMVMGAVLMVTGRAISPPFDVMYATVSIVELLFCGAKLYVIVCELPVHLVGVKVRPG